VCGERARQECARERAVAAVRCCNSDAHCRVVATVTHTAEQQCIVVTVAHTAEGGLKFPIPNPSLLTKGSSISHVIWVPNTQRV
jgi:hypothetical protein